MSLHIETAQNVLLAYNVASIGDRFLAWLLDLVIMIGYLVIVGVVFEEHSADIESWMIIVYMLLPVLFYHLLFELMMEGQSPGKKLRKIKVTMLDGSQPGIGNYLMRWILRLVDAFYGLGFLVMAINGRGQRLGDLAAGTTVISLKPKAGFDDILIDVPTADYQPSFSQVTLLNDSQVALIKEVVNDKDMENKFDHVFKLSEKVQQVMNVRTDMRPKEFLQKVLQDYLYYTGR